MDTKELEYNVKVFASRGGLDESVCRVVPKCELVVGETYTGMSRNSTVAKWDGDVFVYDRRKFGEWLKDSMNHFEDDDGNDVFVPIEIEV